MPESGAFVSTETETFRRFFNFGVKASPSFLFSLFIFHSRCYNRAGIISEAWDQHPFHAFFGIHNNTYYE